MTDDQKHPDAYLGDGVYASFDGYHIWLKTERGEFDSVDKHKIALEPQVFTALLEYARRIWVLEPAMKLEPAMDDEVEAEAVRLARECASTLLSYYQAEQDGLRGFQIDTCWADHRDALDRFERIPGIVDWRELVPQAVLEQLEEARP